MKLYRITQNENTGYDTYDSAVVCAENEEMARDIEPGTGDRIQWEKPGPWGEAWATKRENVEVEHIGVATEGLKRGCVCASFNAG